MTRQPNNIDTLAGAFEAHQERQELVRALMGSYDTCIVAVRVLAAELRELGEESHADDCAELAAGLDLRAAQHLRAVAQRRLELEPRESHRTEARPASADVVVGGFDVCVRFGCVAPAAPGSPVCAACGDRVIG
jgi:hypothetical protein